VNGTDYSVTYSNNVEPGNAAAVASGIGNYTGTLARTFTIAEESREPENATNEGSDGVKKDNREDAAEKNDSTVSIPESAADSAEDPVEKAETEIRMEEGSPIQDGSAAHPKDTEENDMDSSLKGLAVALVLLTAAVIAYYFILLMKRRKGDKENNG
jgi:hypothetical protein